MTFAGISYVAIAVAAVAGWLTGAAWYGVLGKHWVAAQGRSMEEFKAAQAARGASAYVPFALSFIADVVMAWMLAGLLGHVGALTLRGGAISGAFVWLGFVLTTMLVNNAFQGRSYMLTTIDGAHWLAVLLVMGAILGAWGA